MAELLPKDLLESLETGDRTAEHLKTGGDTVQLNPISADRFWSDPLGQMNQQNALNVYQTMMDPRRQSAFGAVSASMSGYFGDKMLGRLERGL